MPLLNYVAGTKGSHEIQTRLLKMQCHLQDSGSTAGRGSGPQFPVIFPPRDLESTRTIKSNQQYTTAQDRVVLSGAIWNISQ